MCVVYEILFFIVSGCLKLECGEKEIKQVVALSPKNYSILLNDNGEIKKQKGIPKNCVKNMLSHGHYYNSVVNNRGGVAHFKKIVSKNHVVHTAELRKVMLTSMDLKRHFLENPRQPSMAFGHYSLVESEELAA